MKKSGYILIGIIAAILIFGCVAAAARSDNDKTSSAETASYSLSDGGSTAADGGTEGVSSDSGSDGGSSDTAKSNEKSGGSSSSGNAVSTSAAKSNGGSGSSGGSGGSDNSGGSGGGSSGSGNSGSSGSSKKGGSSGGSGSQSGTTTKEVTSSTSSEVTCTVTIECKSILNNMDNLKEGHEAYVPADGVIMQSHSVTVKNGSSVYDAVKVACSECSVTINAKNTGYGVYVAGFNNLDEKDCGSQSGWLYSVNGKFPSKSCGKYTVSNGDNIVWSYTC